MDASMSRSGDGYTLALERRLTHSPQKVWRVLTEGELLNQWFPAHVLGEWKVGAELRFEFQHGEGDGLPEEDMLGEVLAVEPERLLAFRWGQHVIRCELIPDGDGCKLLFSETFGDPSWGARDAAGWDFCMENLESLLNGAALAKFVTDQWRERFEHYAGLFAAKFGPQQDMPEDHPGAVGQEDDEGGR